MNHIRLFSRDSCSWCITAKEYLHRHGLAFEEVGVGRNPAAYQEMIHLSGQNYVPTIVANGHVLADFDVRQLEQFLTKLTG